MRFGRKAHATFYGSDQHRILPSHAQMKTVLVMAQVSRGLNGIENRCRKGFPCSSALIVVLVP
jgi:hypothetical protein